MRTTGYWAMTARILAECTDKIITCRGIIWEERGGIARWRCSEKWPPRGRAFEKMPASSSYNIVVNDGMRRCPGTARDTLLERKKSEKPN